jgi:acyl-CoA reductase-like NAD-dependent aldehyde dehydrogenase
MTMAQALQSGGQAGFRTPMQERISFLGRLAQLLEERAETYGRLITAETGRTLADAIGEIKRSALDARYFAEAGRLFSSHSPSPAYREDTGGKRHGARRANPSATSEIFRRNRTETD